MRESIKNKIYIYTVYIYIYIYIYIYKDAADINMLTNVFFFGCLYFIESDEPQMNPDDFLQTVFL